MREALQEYLEEHEKAFIALARLESPQAIVFLEEIEERLDVAR